MRPVEQRMFSPEAKRPLHVEADPRGPREITVVGATGASRHALEHQLLGGPPGHQHRQHMFVPVTSVGRPEVEPDEIVAAVACVDIEAADGAEIEGMMDNCMSRLVERPAPAQIIGHRRAAAADAVFDILKEDHPLAAARLQSRLPDDPLDIRTCQPHRARCQTPQDHIATGRATC